MICAVEGKGIAMNLTGVIGQAGTTGHHIASATSQRR
jgi:hypothetical protein